MFPSNETDQEECPADVDTILRVARAPNNNTDEDDPDGQHWLADSTDSSLDETDIDMLEDALRDKNIYRYKY
jgi:hypothetical protein